MPEHFVLSFIVDKKIPSSDKRLDKVFLSEFGIHQKENRIPQSNFALLKVPGFIFAVIDDTNEEEYKEYFLSFPELVFNQDNFKEEIKPFADFVDICFEMCDRLLFVLGSYELNGYFLSDIKKIKEFDKTLLSKFPIVFIKKGLQTYDVPYEELKYSNLVVNFQAQDIFTQDVFS